MHDITYTLNELIAIRNRLSNKTKIRQLAKNLKKNTRPLELSDENSNLVLPSRPGVYYFEAKFNFSTLSELEEFGGRWGRIRGNDLPTGVPRYYPSRAQKHKRRITRGAFIPFYIGKRENISNRIINHLDGNEGSKTYSLKLRTRPELLNGVELRYSYQDFDIDIDAYYGVEILEANLRRILNPIIGKQ